MKKFLGVSFAAILAVAPMVARADDPITPIAPVTIAANETIGVASTKYVKEAYNAMAGKVNTELAKKQDVIDEQHQLAATNISGLATVATSGKSSDLSNDAGFITKDVNNLTNYTTTINMNTALNAKVTNEGQFTGNTDSSLIKSKTVVNAIKDTATAVDGKVTNAGQFTADSNSTLIKNKTVVEAIQSTATAVDGKQATLTETQLAAVNSGINSTKVATYDGYANGKANVDLNNLSTTGKANVSAQGTYDASTNYASGTVGAAIKGKQDVIDADHKLSVSNISGLATVATSGKASDLTDDSTHRFVTDTEKSTWNAKQAALSAGDGIDMTGNVVKVKADDGLTFDTQSKKLKVDLGSGLAINSTSKKVDVSGITTSNIAANAAIAKTQLASGVQTSLDKADKVGTVTSLTTTTKTDLVSAINEVNGKVLTIYSGWNSGGTPGTTSTVTLTTPAS